MWDLVPCRMSRLLASTHVTGIRFHGAQQYIGIEICLRHGIMKGGSCWFSGACCIFEVQ